LISSIYTGLIGLAVENKWEDIVSSLTSVVRLSERYIADNEFPIQDLLKSYRVGIKRSNMEGVEKLYDFP